LSHSLESSIDAEIVADPHLPSCYHLFPNLDSKKIRYLLLIPFCSRAQCARAVRAWKVEAGVPRMGRV
jgi:hypothetical protein